MGCSGSKVARGDVDMSALPARAPERQHSLPARAASALGSLSFCRGRHDGVHAYTPLPRDEGTLRVAADDGATASLRGKRGLIVVLGDAVSAASSTLYWSASTSSTATAQWPSEFRGEPSSPTPVQFATPEFDPAILSLSRQTMAGPSPSHPALLFPEREATIAMEEPFVRDIPEVTPEVHDSRVVREVEAEEEDVRDVYEEEEVVVAPRPAARARNGLVVVYFTSLRGVRRTFEDGRAVHTILGSYGVRLDDRDVSMHAAFKNELRDLLDGDLTLPRVFIVGDGGQQQQWQWHDLGGADDVRAQHEAGELGRVLEGCEPLGPNFAPCPGCADIRFQPCYTCNGSCKVFAGDEGGYLAGTFQACTDCNENGLIRCPVCCYN